MRLKAQGFLLFTFAFSSALTFTETLETSERVKNAKPTSQSTNKNLTEAQHDKRSFHELVKRSSEIFSQTSDQEEDKKQDAYEANLLKEDAPDKRTRVGFTGMRGKKEFSADDYCSKNLRARLEGALNKRFLTSFNEMLGGKRTSLAFHGMRGKKSGDYDSKILSPEPFEGPPPEVLLMNSGLMDETEPLEFPEEKPEDESRGEEEWSKRSPYAFQGTRGKKEYAYDLKRAMGFLGMRGKKDTDIWGSDYKRAPQTSFFGMKGKKAQSSGFFGMRGKKSSPNAFFGIKGKREPLGYNLEDFRLLNEMKELGPTNNRFRRGITWLNNSKKAKNSFFGLRGKKSSPERPTFSFSPSF